jgi:hypothetical protein
LRVGSVDTMIVHERETVERDPGLLRAG